MAGRCGLDWSRRDEARREEEEEEGDDESKLFPLSLSLAFSIWFRFWFGFDLGLERVRDESGREEAPRSYCKIKYGVLQCPLSFLFLFFPPRNKGLVHFTTPINFFLKKIKIEMRKRRCHVRWAVENVVGVDWSQQWGPHARRDDTWFSPGHWNQRPSSVLSCLVTNK